MKGGRSQPETKSTKLAAKKNGSASAKLGKKQSQKVAKDPNKPKRPASAFFVFMEEFRQLYKEKHPDNKSVAVVGKAGGEKWKSMSVAEKAPYAQKAEARKEEYEKNMKAYDKKLAEGAKDEGEEESEKPVSEVNDGNESGDDEDDEWEAT